VHWVVPAIAGQGKVGHWKDSRKGTEAIAIYDNTYATTVDGGKDAMDVFSRRQKSASRFDVAMGSTETLRVVGADHLTEADKQAQSAEDKGSSFYRGLQWFTFKGKRQPGLYLSKEKVRLFDGVEITAKEPGLSKGDKATGGTFEASELRKYTIKQVGGAYYFYGGREPNQLDDERDVYLIVPQVIDLLKTRQADAIKAIIGDKKLSEPQKDLLGRADTFLGDASLHGKYKNFEMNSFLENDTGEKVSHDLIDRVNLMYKYFQHAGLVVYGNLASTKSGKDQDGVNFSGTIRHRTNSHRMATSYYMYSKVGADTGKRKTFIDNLRAVSGDDGKDNVGYRWAEPAWMKQAAEGDVDGAWTLMDQARKDGLLPFEGPTSSKGAQTDPAAEGFPKDDPLARYMPIPAGEAPGVSRHCGGEAIDISFPFVMNAYDPIIDLIGMKFGLYRPVRSSEDWHWERLGVNPMAAK
jgi:hypothetical protein